GATDTLFARTPGSFHTFPDPDDGEKHLKIVVGSCNYFDNFPLFESVRRFDPHLFLHLGDWNYPPSAPGQGWDYNLDPYKRARSFALRYRDENMRRYVLPRCAVDYIYDDDWSQNGVQGTSWPVSSYYRDSTGKIRHRFDTQYMDSAHRVGAIRAYVEHFPGYPLPDSAHGIFHAIRMGKTEFFVTDVRTSSTPQNWAYVYDSTEEKWRFDPESLGDSHTLLGRMQRSWLISGLENSDAHWRFIASGVVFNKRYREFINTLMPLQELEISVAGRNETAGTYSAALAYNWAAYPTDLNAVLDLAQAGKLNRTVFLSGDSHSSAIDDGTNAGIPELMSSGLAAGNEGYLNYYINQFSRILIDKSVKEILWNRGGNGVENDNFADTYATLEIFGRDSLRMRVVDEFDQVLASYTIFDGATGRSTVPRRTMTVVYPNPAKDRLVVEFARTPTPKDALVLATLDGKTVKTVVGLQKTHTLTLSDLPEGLYVLIFNGEETRKIWVRARD
ncbi:MAG: alkaline phosphatase D family protein, partial [Bacteroidia bacterium]|nr:alkaline phosphatase D family protein [Bacteroidia bacterium]